MSIKALLTSLRLHEVSTPGFAPRCLGTTCWTGELRWCNFRGWYTNTTTLWPSEKTVLWPVPTVPALNSTPQLHCVSLRILPLSCGRYVNFLYNWCLNLSPCFTVSAHRNQGKKDCMMHTLHMDLRRLYAMHFVHIVVH